MPLSVYHGDTDGHRPNHADDARQSSNRTRHGKQQNHRTGCGQHRVTGRRGISGRRFSVDDERTRQQTLDTANTAICPANHQRRRISAVIMPIAAIVQLTAITSQDCATAFITPVAQDGTSLCRFFQTSSSYDCPFSVNTHPHHTPKPIAIRSRPNTTHSTRLEIRGRTVSGSSRAKPRSISDAPSASSMSSGLKSRKEPDVDTDASEPETGPSAANGSTTFDDESGCAAPEPTRLTAACGSRILGVCASFIRSTVRPRPGQGTTLVPAHSQIRT